MLPYELDERLPCPGVCIGTDVFHKPQALIELSRSALAGMSGGIDLDMPFAGTYVPTRHYRTDARVQSVMIEIRRDLYLDEPTHAVHTDPLVARLAQLIGVLAE